MAKIFISYRREDSRWQTGSIQERLRSLLPRDEIYFDVDSIPAGLSFRDHLEGAVAECDYVIAVVGKTWATVCDENGHRRLDNPNDWVRIELETALARGIPVIPVLLDTMTMPEPSLLPDSLKGFSERQAVCVRPHPDFDNDIQKISRAIQRHESQREARAKSHSLSVQSAAKVRLPRRPLIFGGIAIAILVPIVFVLLSWLAIRSATERVPWSALDLAAVTSVPGDSAAKMTVKPVETITNSIGMKLALIPAGEFLMGSPDGEKDRSNAEKQHRVRITRSYYLGTHKVTRGQFGQFVETASYQTDAEKDDTGGDGWDEAEKKFRRDPKFTWRNPGFEQTDEHPVVNVSWNDAVAFCTWLSKQERRQYRLPTEAEWEYACRAGTTTRFFNGDDPERLALVGDIADGIRNLKDPGGTTISARDGYVYTAPVGRFRANAFALYDMHGNVWEWCSDWFETDYYANSPDSDPQGPASGALSVIRGGGWSSGPSLCRSANRSFGDPLKQDSDLGFRVCLNP